MADTPLLKKLGIKPKHRVLILNAPEGYREQFGTLPADVELITTPTSAGNFEVVHLFIRNKAEVERDVPMAIKLVKPGGLRGIALGLVSKAEFESPYRSQPRCALGYLP